MNKIKFLLLIFFIQIITFNALSNEKLITESYYVVDSSCCGGEDSDPHPVFGISSNDGFILLGKSLGPYGKENGFVIKIPSNLPENNIFLNPSEDFSYDWSIVIGEKKKRDALNSAVIFNNHLFVAGYKETKKKKIDRFLAKINLKDGSVVWSKSYPSKKKKSSAFESITLTQENGILLTGITNANYKDIEGFKSYGNPVDGNAFSMYFSQDQIVSDKEPLNPIWVKDYKNSLSGKSVKKLINKNEYVIASSSHEPMIAKVLKISKNGDLIWEKQYPNHGEITDISVADNAFFLSGHKSNLDTGLDASVTKISQDGKVLWNQTFGNPLIKEFKNSNQMINNESLIYDECWSIATFKNNLIALACGTGIEHCDDLKNKLKKYCERDPRTTWRSYILVIDYNGKLIAEKTSSFYFPEDENADDVASTASEWVFITDKDQIASINDLDFGAGIEILNFN